MDPIRPALEFQWVHDQFRPRVLRYLTRMVGEADAEDLTQSVMLKVSRALPDFRGDSSLATWVLRIARNVALDSVRRKSLKLVSLTPAESDDDWEEGLEQASPVESVEAGAIRSQTSSCIRGFVERLPGNYRAPLVLSDFEGFTNEEIAALLGLTVGTVKIRLHRGREKLREALAAGCSFDHDAQGALGCDPKPQAVAIALHR